MDYTETFRLFCTTRLPNPHFTPELSARVTVIDFTVTQAGLEDQLLGKLILKARRRAPLSRPPCCRFAQLLVQHDKKCLPLLDQQ